MQSLHVRGESVIGLWVILSKCLEIHGDASVLRGCLHVREEVLLVSLVLRLQALYSLPHMHISLQ